MSAADGFYDYRQGIVQALTYRELGSSLLHKIVSCLTSPPDRLPDDPYLCYKMWPACVNLAFSCEISMKLLLWKESGEMTRGHRLKRDLYCKLSDKRRSAICERVITQMRPLGSALSDYSSAHFDEDLSASDSTFFNERYVFELTPGVGHGLKPAFLDVFSEVLLNEARALEVGIIQ